MALILLQSPCGAPTEMIQPGRFASVCVGNCGIGYWNLKISVMTKENMLIDWKTGWSGCSGAWRDG